MNCLTQRLRSTVLPLCISTGLALAAPVCAAQAQTGMAIGPDLYARLAPPIFRLRRGAVPQRRDHHL